jgi:hypothetical protein
MKRQIIPPDPDVDGADLDYVAYLRDHVQPHLYRVNHGQAHHNEGQILLCPGNYLLDRPLLLHPLNQLTATSPCRWTSGPSTSLQPSNEWTSGQHLTKRDLPAPGHYYQNFLTGLSDLNLKCVSPNGRVRVSGPHETLSQQSRIERCKAWGYGPGRVGFTIGGDVWRMIDCIADRDTVGQHTPPRGDGSIGFKSIRQQLREVRLENCTSHNNETGVQIHYALGGSVQLESETTRTPFRLTGNACDLEVRLSCQHHHHCVAHIAAAKEGNFDIRIHGNAEHGRHCIILPDGRKEWLHRFAESSTPRVRADARSVHTPGAISFDVRIWRHGSQLKIEHRKK